jgi:O-antigen/teichoic acid export membrane protein
MSVLENSLQTEGPRVLLRQLRSALAQDTLFVFISNAVIAGGGMAFWLLAARRYEPELVGVGSALTALLVLLGTLGQLGLGVGLLRYASALGPRRRLWLLAIFVLTLAASLAAGATFWLLAPWATPELAGALARPADGALFAGLCAAWALSALFDSYLIGRRLLGLLVANNLAGALARLAALTLVAQPSALALVAATAAGGLVGVLAVAPLLARCPSPPTTAPPVTLPGLLGYSLWNSCTTLAATVATQAMPALVVSLAGGAQAAAYYLVWAMFSGLLMIPSALAQALLAQRARAGRAGLPVELTGTRAAMLAALLLLAFLPLALLVLWVLGPSYLAYGAPALPLLALGAWPAYRSMLLQTEIRLGGSQGWLALAYLAAYASILLMSAYVLPAFGVTGAALGWTLGQWVLFDWLRRLRPTGEA